MTAEDGQQENQSNYLTLRTIVVMLIFVVIVPFLPLLISRQWDWVEAWIYGFIGVFGFAISRILVARRHPDLLAERARYTDHKDAKSWDKTLSPLVGFGGGLIPLVAGLDALFGWPASFSTPLKIVALVCIVGGYVLGTYAMLANRFFSGMVRIQTDRGHEVVSSGPYRWVRHPGYVGALLSYLATPIWLDSRWAFLPALFLTIVLIIRTHLEDTALKEELAGYREYTEQVRYRLLPGVW